MKIIECPPGSHEWLCHRMGRVTASCADLIMTPNTRKPSAQASKYLDRLIAETLMGRPIEDDVGSYYMHRGKEKEEQAREEYAQYWSLSHGENVVATKPALVVSDDDGRMACSPDCVLWSEAGEPVRGADIKILSAANHVRMMIRRMTEPEPSVKAHQGQIQYSLMVSGLSEWDLVYWHERLPIIVYTYGPDESWRRPFRDALGRFFKDYEDILGQLCKHYRIQRPDGPGKPYCRYYTYGVGVCKATEDLEYVDGTPYCPAHAHALRASNERDAM